MRTAYQTFMVGLALTVFAVTAWGYPDPGIPDTVKIEGGPLLVGQSLPLSLTIVNDEILGCYQVPLLFTTFDGGFAKFDSIVYVNRMADPNVLSVRPEGLKDTNGFSPDSIIVGATASSTSPLPIGNTPVFLMYFTGMESGVMRLDTGFIPPVGYLLLCDQYGNDIYPQFQSLQVPVLEGRLPPVITAPETPFQTAIGTETAFAISAVSPDAAPVSLQILSMTDYDDTLRLPDAEPTLGSGNPADFSWTPAANDVGIWMVTFRASDTASLHADRSVIIQTISENRFLIPFSISQRHNPGYGLAVTHGDFNDDGASELLVGGIAGPDTSSTLFEWTSSTDWIPTYGLTHKKTPFFSPQPGYSDTDAFLDVVGRGFWDGASHVTVLAGDGANDFSVVGSSNDGTATRSIALGQFNGDQYVDAAATWYDGVHMFAGDGANGYDQMTLITTGDSALSVNSADFNGDGYDDMAVGTVAGIEIYLGNGQGAFTRAYSYVQTYGSKEIEVTNQGSDFDNDDMFDLCISTPSVGGQYSQMMLYLGNGDGSFDQQVIRSVQGQIFGNCVGDFDGDGNLDIGYVNGARRYMAVLFGNGDGSFTNELRWDIPGHAPQSVDCFDVDLDGDLDAVVVANGDDDTDPDNVIFTFLNQRNPGDFEKRAIALSGRDNAALELVSASGKTFNSVRNTMPSGDYFRRNLDQNDAIDDYAAMGVVESGRYTLSVRPKPDRPVGEPFSLEFTCDGQLFRLAENIPMTASGYDFPVFMNGASDVLPISGAFIAVNPPTFAWSGKGEYDFQLATDIDFTELVVETVVSGNSITLASPLSLADTTIYYWRMKSHGAPDYEALYAVNLVPASGSSCGDANADGLINIGDAVYLVTYLFRGGPAPVVMADGDANCDGAVNIGDAVYLITFIFRGGPAPCCP